MADHAKNSFRLWLWVLGLCLIGGFGFYEWLLYERWDKLGAWGNLGSAIAPIGALLSAGAVFAALRSIELQREALAGQQEELAKQQAQIERHMTLLEEQRTQFVRTAKAQERLALAQEMATDANIISALTHATAQRLDYATRYAGDDTSADQAVMYAGNLAALGEILAGIYTQSAKLKAPMHNPLVNALATEDAKPKEATNGKA